MRSNQDFENFGLHWYWSSSGLVSSSKLFEKARSKSRRAIVIMVVTWNFPQGFMFTQISEHFRAYLRLHWADHPDLGITGKIFSSCNASFGQRWWRQKWNKGQRLSRAPYGRNRRRFKALHLRTILHSIPVIPDFYSVKSVLPSYTSIVLNFSSNWWIF